MNQSNSVGHDQVHNSDNSVANQSKCMVHWLQDINIIELSYVTA